MLKVGQSVMHRGLGREVEIIGEFNSHYQCRDGKQVINAAKIPNIDLVPPREFTLIDTEKETEDTPETININEISAANLAKSLKGVGQLAARRIIDRKPEGGYLGLEQIKMLNADVSINWEAVLPHISFSQ